MVIVSSSVKNLQKGTKKKVKGVVGGGSNSVGATATPPGNSKSKGSIKAGGKNAGVSKFPPRPIPRPITIGSPAIVGAGRGKVKTTRNNTLPLPSPKAGLLAANGPRIHAQRKFAQGASTTFTTSTGGTTTAAATATATTLKLARNSPAVTPTKETTTTATAKFKKRVLTPISPPLKRPKTEDFLTFLCFRGTPSLPPQLDYFTFSQPLQAEQIQVQTKKLKEVAVGVGCNTDDSQNARPPSHPPSSGATSVATKQPRRANGSSLVEVGVGILKKKINGVQRNGLSITAIAKKTTGASSPSQKKILPGKEKASDNETSPTQTFPSASRINEQDAKFAMTALKLKYQEKRLANQRPAKSLITMLTKKVKERSMVLTRSRAQTAVGPLKTSPIQGKLNKPVIKPPVPKPLPRNAPSPDIILGVAQSPVKSVEKRASSGSESDDSGSDSSKKSSSGKSSRSSSSSSDSDEKANNEPATRSLRNGKEVAVSSSKPSKSAKSDQKNIPPRHSKKMGGSGSSSPGRVGTRASHRHSKSPLRELPMWNVHVKKKKILAKYKKANTKAKAQAKKAAESKGTTSSSQNLVRGHVTRSALRKISSVNKKEKEGGRPSRKTKETAAFYLGLINKGFSSDDEQSSEESDNDEKGSSSGDTSSSETKFLEKQYKASQKRTTTTTTSSASSSTSGKKKRDKSRSTSPASTKKDKSKKEKDAKSDSDSKTEKPKPLPRVLRSQSGGSVDSGRSRTDSQAERRRLFMMTCGKDTAGAARKSAKIISRGRRGSRQYSSSEEEDEDNEGSANSDMDIDVDVDDDDKKETDVEASDSSEEEEEKRVTRSRSVTNSPMSIPSSRGSKAKVRRVEELIEEEKCGKREKRTSSVSSARSSARSSPVDTKSVKSEGGKSTPGGKGKQSEVEEDESEDEEEASEDEVEDPIPEDVKSDEDMEEKEEAHNVACSPLPNLQNSEADTTGSESEEESEVEEDEDEEDADSPEPPQMITIGIQVDMDLEEEEENKRKEEEEEARRKGEEDEARKRKEEEEEAAVPTSPEENSNSIPDSPDPPTPEDSEETCQSARTKGITLPLSDQQKAQLQEAQEEDDEIQEIGQVINNPRAINHHHRPRRSSPSPPIIPIEPDAPRITHIHPTPPHPQPQHPHQHQHIPHSQPQHIPPLTIPHPMPPLTSRTSSLTYTSHQINLGGSSVPFVPYTSRPPDFFPAPPMHFGPAHLVNSVHLVGSSTTGMDFTSELNSPLSTLSIPVSSFPNPLMPHHPNICLGPGGAATMTATSLQTHIRTVATNLDIPLVRPVVGTTTDTALSFSAMGMSGASHLGGIPLIGHPPPHPHNLLTRPPMSSWAQTAAAAAHAHVQAAHAAAAANEARNHFSAFRLPTMTPTSSAPSQMGTHHHHQEPLLRPPVSSALPVSIVQPRGHHHHHHHHHNIPTQNHQHQGGHHHHHHNHSSSTSSASTSVASTSYGYNPESIIRNLPNVSIVPKFDRSSVKTQLPSQNPQSSSSSSKSKHGGTSNSSRKSEERRHGKKKSKPTTLPAPPSPLTVRKDSVNPATYVGLSSKLKKKLDLNEKPKDKTEQSSSKDSSSSTSSSSIKFDKHLVVKQERPDPDMPLTSSASSLSRPPSASNSGTKKDNERSSPAVMIRPEQIKQEIVMSSSSASCSSNIRKSHSPCITSIHRMTPDRPSSSSSANSSSAKHPNLQTEDGTAKKRKGGSGKKSHSQSSTSSTTASIASNGKSYNSKMMEAPTYHPTEQEFADPLKYFEKIQPEAEKFGMARIVPPGSFRPECNVNDDMRFTAYNHYIHKMFKRWGPTVKETEAIKEHLKRTDMDVSTVPVIGGIEIDFSTLHQVVQSLGGLKEVIEEEKWADVADRMHIPKGTHDRATKLDSVYVKYILPYAMLSDDERANLKGQVEEKWVTRQQKLKERTESSSEDETSDEDSMDELDDCVIKGKGTPLSAYYRTARNTVGMIFPNGKEPPINELEEEYWKIVRDGVKHLCVYSGSIDCAGVGWGFPAPKASSKHPWNLKVLANNQGSVLKSMGPVMGATVPTLHVSMLFTSYCWYRDPHGLPWVEYLHSGASKIWYSVAAANEPVLRKALMKLMPLQCKNKKLWLPSDSAMVPPELLIENDVPLVRAVQNPGEFLVVFPKSYTSAICAGYLVSESVCFAPPVWLRSCMEIFKDIRDSKEPPVFPIEKLLLSIIRDNKASSSVIKMAAPLAEKVITEELALRKKLSSMGVSLGGKPTSKNISGKGVSKKKKTPAAEEESEQCYFCNYILHMSLVRNDRTDFVTCLNHAIQHLSRHKAQIKKCTMLCEDTQEELEALLQTAKRRANS